MLLGLYSTLPSFSDNEIFWEMGQGYKIDEVLSSKVDHIGYLSKEITDEMTEELNYLDQIINSLQRDEVIYDDSPESILVAKYLSRLRSRMSLVRTVLGLHGGITMEGSKNFRRLNAELFDNVTPDLFEMAICPQKAEAILDEKWLQKDFVPVFGKFMDRAKAVIGQPREKISSETLADRYTRAFIELGYPHCSGRACREMRNFATAGPHILVPNADLGRLRSFETSWRMYCHELKHAVCYQAGYRTGHAVLAYGTAGYHLVDEGSAMLFEAGSAESFIEGVKRAWERYILACVIEGLDGDVSTLNDVYRKTIKLCALNSPNENADRIERRVRWHMQNAYRAFAVYDQPKLYYARLTTYWDSLFRVVKWLQDRKDIEKSLHLMLSGSFNFTDPEELGIVTMLGL